MKRKKYLHLITFLLSFVIVMIACDDDDGPPPVVNQPPVISGLNDLTLNPDFGTHEIDFANYVSDLEGDIVTYQVSNSDDLVITISLNSTVLTITEVGLGSSDIIVIATDGGEDHAVSDTFTVTVEPIGGAEDYSGNALFMWDFNGLGSGSVYDVPIPNFNLEGWLMDWEYGDFGSFELVNNDHLLIVNNIEGSWIWTDWHFDDFANQDFTGKKLRFDISYFTSPTLTGTHWDDDEDLSAVDIRIYYIDDSWETNGGQYFFSDLNLEYSSEWQGIEIPLSDFSSFWGLPVDASAVAFFGMEIYGGTESDPISFRLDNVGIVD